MGEEAATTHVEGGTNTKSPGVVTGLVLNDHVVTLDSDELRDQMAAQVKETRLKFTSAASLQMCFYLFVAYCSKPLGVF